MGLELDRSTALDLWRTVTVMTVRGDEPDLTARQMAVLMTVYLSPAPHTVRGLVASESDARGVSGAIRRHLALWHCRPDFLAYDVRDLPSRFAGAQRCRGVPVATWTVRDADDDARVEAFADAAIFEGTVGKARTGAPADRE